MMEHEKLELALNRIADGDSAAEQDGTQQQRTSEQGAATAWESARNMSGTACISNTWHDSTLCNKT